MDKNKKNLLTLILILAAILVNIGITLFAKQLALPWYLNSIGTILATLLLGWQKGAVAGVISYSIISIFFAPLALYFIVMQIVVAIITHKFARHRGFINVWAAAGSGFRLGFIVALVSAPILLIFLIKDFDSNAIIISFFVKLLGIVFNLVFLLALSINYCLECILAFFILKTIPKKFLEIYRTELLRCNHFIISKGNKMYI